MDYEEPKEQSKAKKAKTSKREEPAEKVEKKGRLVKGSDEAKEYMNRLRSLRKPKASKEPKASE